MKAAVIGVGSGASRDVVMAAFPRHKVVVQSSFTLPQAVEVGLTYRYVSDLPGSDQKVASYSTGDVRIGKRLSRDFELSVVGQNLLQPGHAEYAGDPGGQVLIKRSAYLRLSWTMGR